MQKSVCVSSCLSVCDVGAPYAQSWTFRLSIFTRGSAFAKRPRDASCLSV